MPKPRSHAIQALINDPENWLMGEAISAPKMALGAGQVLPRARDAIEMLKRLQGGLSKVPESAKTLLRPTFQFSPQQTQMMEKMYQEANPVFKRMQAAGMFDRFKP